MLNTILVTLTDTGYFMLQSLKSCKFHEGVLFFLSVKFLEHQWLYKLSILFLF